MKNLRLFPREGLYIDPLWSAFCFLFLNPLFTAVPAYFLLKSPAKRLSDVVCALFISGCLHHANIFLTKWARNNWTKSDDWNWNNEVVLITGGSSGIGASLVKKLATRKIKVVVVGVSQLPYPTAPYVHFYRCDLTDAEQFKVVARRIREDHGDPTVIINNAGICRGFTVTEGKASDVGATFAVNALAAFSTLREFLPAMARRNHGHIVTIASPSGYVPPIKMVDYGASKAASIALHEGVTSELRLHLRAPKVRTTLAVPSYIDTGLFTGDTKQSRFLLPLLHVETVTDAIVEQLLSGYGATIYLPKMVWILPMVRALPEWIQIGIHGKASDTAVDFTGKQTVDERTGRIGLRGF